jgi:hypothetical protein
VACFEFQSKSKNEPFMKPHLFYWSVCSTLLMTTVLEAQSLPKTPCFDYQCIMTKVDTLKNYRAILNHLAVAESYLDPKNLDQTTARRKVINQKREQVFDWIEKARDKALNAEAQAKQSEKKALTEKLKAQKAAQNALIAEAKAKKAEQNALDQKRYAQKALNQIYFYKGQFGLAYKDGKYGFIAPDMTEKIHFDYEEATSFDRDGFAKVKKNIKDRSYFLLDTAEKKYKLTTDIQQLPLDSTIEALDLRYLNLDTFPPIYGQKNLKVLLINGNNIKILKDSISNLTNLEYLNLSDNELKTLPTTFGQLQHLQTLYLVDNKLVTLPETFGQLSNLKYLDLSDDSDWHNQLDSLPSTFGQLTHLKFLNLNGNTLRSLPKKLGQLTELEFLGLNDNLLKEIPKEISQLRSLQELDVRNTFILPETLAPIKDSLSTNCTVWSDDSISIFQRYVDEQLKKDKGQDTSVLMHFYPRVIQANEQACAKSPCSEAIKKDLIEQYKKLAWIQLHKGLFSEAEHNIRRGMALDKTNYELITNFPLVLLMQGNKYREAEENYLNLKDKIAFLGISYQELFLGDLNEFEKKGIIPKERQADVEKIIQLLNQN